MMSSRFPLLTIALICAIAVTCAASLEGKSTQHTSSHRRGEYKILGDTGSFTLASLHNADPEVKKASDTILKTKGGVALTFGDIVAIAGDLVSGSDDVICQGVNVAQKYRRFKLTFKRLMHVAENGGGADEYPALHDWINKQMEGLKRSSVPKKLRSLISSSNKDRYPPNSKNFGHFGKCAQDAYRIGHVLAQVAAHKAGKELNETLGAMFRNHTKTVDLQQSLTRAYMMDAMALVFLSDQFAGGHIRTNRLLLHRFCNKADPVTGGGTAAQYMYDEENINGVYTTSRQEEYDAREAKQKMPKFWWSFGGRMFHHPFNKENRDRAGKAIQLSRDEIWQAFRDGFAGLRHHPRVAALDQIPNDDLAREKLNEEYYMYNTCPMFSFDREGARMLFRNPKKPRAPIGVMCTPAPIWNGEKALAVRFRAPHGRPAHCNGPFKAEEISCAYTPAHQGSMSVCPLAAPKEFFLSKQHAYYTSSKSWTARLAATLRIGGVKVANGMLDSVKEKLNPVQSLAPI